MQKFTSKILFLFVFLTSCSVGSLAKRSNYQEVGSEDYLNYINDSSVQIIDVRTRGEYKKSHIDGAINCGYLGGDFKNEVKNAKLDPNKTTLIYCETQHRSLFAAKKLYQLGYKEIIDLDKGMMRWRKDGYPYISDTLKSE